VNTVRTLVTDPRGFFQTLRREGGLGQPLVYAFLGNMIGWLMVARVPDAHAVRWWCRRGRRGFFVMVFVLPVAVVVGLFLWSGLLHVVLQLVGGAGQPFETTFRVVAYTSGTTSLANIVPWCGGVIGAAVAIAFSIIGLSEAHRNPGRQGGHRRARAARDLLRPRAAVRRHDFRASRRSASAPPSPGRTEAASPMRLVWRHLAPGELDHELVWSAVGLASIALAGLAVWLRAVPPLVCPLSAWAALPCPTCGSTRALFALVAGDWAGALRLNPLTTLAAGAALPWLAHGVVASLLRLPRLRLRPDPADRRRLRLLAWLAIAFAWVFLIVDGR
jgi:hypothetical protein